MFAKSTLIADAMKRRGVRRMVYFHCDHFEPWRDERGTISERNAADVREFAEVTSKLEYARRLTLFYKCHVPTTMSSSPRSWFAEGDGLGFQYPTDEHFAITGSAMRHIAHETGHEIQVHVHHEYYIGNDKYCFIPTWSRSFFEQLNTPELDQLRFKLGLELTLKTIRREADIPLARWMFVHGTWALNASDPDVCSITNEIELLQQYGCLGDFTFPAGRRHCDPDYTEPVFVRPFTAPKGYNLKGAQAEPAFGNAGAAMAEKFFIWASVIKAGGSSIDHYWDWVRKRSEDVGGWALDIVENSVVRGDTLFFKTHSHSMYMDYFDGDATPVHPHAYPGVRNLFGVILQAASEANVAVDYLTVSEAYERFVGVNIAALPELIPPAPIPTTHAPSIHADRAPEPVIATGDPATMADEAGIPARVSLLSEAEIDAMYQTAATHYHANDFAASSEAWEELRPHLDPGSYRMDHYFYYQMKNIGLGLGRRADALDLSDHALSMGRNHGGSWFVRGVLLCHEGRNMEAMTALRRAFRLDAERGYAALNMAAILTEAGRYRLAWKLIEIARAAGTSENGFGTIIATAALGAARPREALAAIKLLEKAGDLVPPEIRDIARSMLDNQYRHIAIAGASQEAATMLGILLGSLADVCHVGDTAQLSQPVGQALATGTFGVAFSPDAPSTATCRICGTNCELTAPQFRQWLAKDPVDWYRKIARQLHAGVLVTSDRFATEYRIKDPGADYDQVILFSKPENWVAEIRRQVAAGTDSSEWDISPDASVSDLLDHWAENYRSLLRDVRPRQRIVLNWNRLSQDAPTHFAALLRQLALPGSPDIFATLRPLHLLGGSHSDRVMAMLTQNTASFATDPRPPLDTATHEAVDLHERAQTMYRRLDRLHRLQFGTVN